SKRGAGTRGSRTRFKPYPNSPASPPWYGGNPSIVGSRTAFVISAASSNGRDGTPYRSPEPQTVGSAVMYEYRPRSTCRSAESRNSRCGRCDRRRATSHGSGAGTSSTASGPPAGVGTGTASNRAGVATSMRSVYAPPRGDRGGRDQE